MGPIDRTLALVSSDRPPQPDISNEGTTAVDKVTEETTSLTAYGRDFTI